MMTTQERTDFYVDQFEYAQSVYRKTKDARTAYLMAHGYAEEELRKRLYREQLITSARSREEAADLAVEDALARLREVY